MSSSEFETDPSNRRQARENACAEGTIAFVSLLIGWESGASFVNQLQSVRELNKSKHVLLLTLN